MFAELAAAQVPPKSGRAVHLPELMSSSSTQAPIDKCFVRLAEGLTGFSLGICPIEAQLSFLVTCELR